jgi:hypothetical protein
VTGASDQLERWLRQEGDKTLGNLIETFEEKSFAFLFVLLLAVPALPLPTGGATHVFEIIAMLLALQLIVGRDEIWLPQKWRDRELAGGKSEAFIVRLMKMIRFLERFSRPRLTFLFNHRVSSVVFGLLVLAVPGPAVHRPGHAARARRRAAQPRLDHGGRADRAGRRGRRRGGRRAGARPRQGGGARHRVAVLSGHRRRGDDPHRRPAATA